jgi:hypothetical protein
LDAKYPASSDSYLRDVVSAEAFARADRLDAALTKAMPAHYVGDPGFAFGANGAGIDLLGEMQSHELARRDELDMLVADLLRHLGAHSRNLVRALVTKAD